MQNKKVRAAVEEIRSAKDIAARKLTPKEYQDLLGELMAEAESWRMELEEGEGGEE